jgi:hypothetical protein
VAIEASCQRLLISAWCNLGRRIRKFDGSAQELDYFRRMATQCRCMDSATIFNYDPQRVQGK